MERQLLGSARAPSPVEVAQRLVGVQAQVTSSAALAIALRARALAGMGAPAPTEQTARALRERRLVRSWAMRGTLHLFAAEDVPTVAAALGRKEHWRRPAWLRWFGVDEPAMEALIDTIGEVLDDGRPRTRAELADEIGGRLGPRAGKLLLGSWGSALKVASARHYLVQSAEDEAGVRFVRASRWVEAWREEDEDAALATLIERYLAAYGPATVREIRRWWGVATLADIRPAIARLAHRLAEVDVDGTRALVRTEDLDAIAATPATDDDVVLVGGFDPFIVGAGLRDRLLPAAHLKRVSRTAGWISPVVLVDGRAAGVWDAKRSGDRLTITVDAFHRFSAATRRAIGRAGERVAAAQGATATLAYGPVFTEKGPPLVITPANA
ncbi:MAG TPA: winged helix DNA-binding domain-containing protein [Candidatus Dormibacteraeota bacterium]|nr:winged helix DNA-binding domain-containing protein [Candidatus Dormibacteraeota bacterium]